MVARRAHNPEVVWFKSHLRNQKRNSIRMDAVLFCLRSPNAEPPSSRPCGSDGIAPHQTNDLAHISARSGGYKSHLRNQKRNSIRMDAVLFCLRSPNAEPPPSRPCGSDGIAPHQTNGLAHISARSGGYKSHLRNQKTSRTKFGKVLLFHET